MLPILRLERRRLKTLQHKPETKDRDKPHETCGERPVPVLRYEGEVCCQTEEGAAYGTMTESRGVTFPLAGDVWCVTLLETDQRLKGDSHGLHYR